MDDWQSSPTLSPPQRDQVFHVHGPDLYHKNIEAEDSHAISYNVAREVISEGLVSSVGVFTQDRSNLDQEGLQQNTASAVLMSGLVFSEMTFCGGDVALGARVGAGSTVVGGGIDLSFEDMMRAERMSDTYRGSGEVCRLAPDHFVEPRRERIQRLSTESTMTRFPFRKNPGGSLNTGMSPANVLGPTDFNESVGQKRSSLSPSRVINGKSPMKDSTDLRRVVVVVQDFRVPERGCNLYPVLSDLDLSCVDKSAVSHNPYTSLDFERDSGLFSLEPCLSPVVVVASESTICSTVTQSTLDSVTVVHSTTTRLTPLKFVDKLHTTTTLSTIESSLETTILQHTTTSSVVLDVCSPKSPPYVDTGVTTPTSAGSDKSATRSEGKSGIRVTLSGLEGSEFLIQHEIESANDDGNKSILIRRGNSLFDEYYSDPTLSLSVIADAIQLCRDTFQLLEAPQENICMSVINNIDLRAIGSNDELEIDSGVGSSDTPGLEEGSCSMTGTEFDDEMNESIVSDDHFASFTDRAVRSDPVDHLPESNSRDWIRSEISLMKDVVISERRRRPSGSSQHGSTPRGRLV